MQFVALMLQSPANPDFAKHLVVLILTIIPILIVVGLAITILPFWFILKKAGYSPWLSLINILPFGTLVLLYVLAFGEWRVDAEIPSGWPQPPPPQQG
jgi:branched-subunit amino acid transport protein AzlD